MWLLEELYITIFSICMEITYRSVSGLMTKSTKWLRSAKPQINLGIHPVWSESSLCIQWVAKDSNFLHGDSKDSHQTRWHFVVFFVMRQLICGKVKFSWSLVYLRFLVLKVAEHQFRINSTSEYFQSMQHLNWCQHLKLIFSGRLGTEQRVV